MYFAARYCRYCIKELFFQQAESLREQLACLLEEKEKRSLEQTNLQNELERKSVMAKAAQESQANHLERLVVAERKIETLQDALKKVEEQLLKETQARKVCLWVMCF